MTRVWKEEEFKVCDNVWPMVWKKVCCFRVGDHGLKGSVVSNLGTVSVPGFEIAVFHSWTQ